MKVVLMDRDGTVVVEPPTFAVVLDGLELFPDTLEAMTKLAQAGYSVVFVTNQISIARGNLTVEEYEATNDKIAELLQPTGVNILKTYFCPHAPEDNCECRKPKPKMLQDAIKDFNLNPAETFMIGDRVTDVQAGKAAGTKTILIPQGNFDERSAEATYVATNLLEAVNYVLEN